MHRSAALWAGLLAALLLTSAFSYRVAERGRKFSFPRDHSSHPDFKTEWWYYTGHLETEEGRNFGYQVTFFRFGLRDRQEGENAAPFTDLYFAHFALSDKSHKNFLFRERAQRGHDGKAGALTDRYLVWNESWKVEGKDGSHWIEVQDRDDALKLKLTPLKAAVLHGESGLSRKGEGRGRASYYYSLSRLQSEGDLTYDGKRFRVRGLSWMDHEFGSDQLGEEQVGWDWFSIQLDNRTELMLYLIRRRGGSLDPYSSGTLISRDGSARHLKQDEFHVKQTGQWKSPQSGALYPMGWEVRVPAAGIEIELAPFFPGQELVTEKSTRVTYWEGAVQVKGRYGKEAVTGQGYVEMTGYAERLRL